MRRAANRRVALAAALALCACDGTSPTPQPTPSPTPTPVASTVTYVVEPCFTQVVPGTGGLSLRGMIIPDTLKLDLSRPSVGSSRVDLQACKLEYSIVSPK